MKILLKNLDEFAYKFLWAFIVFSGFTDISVVWHLLLLAVFVFVYLANARRLKQKSGSNKYIFFFLLLSSSLFIISAFFSPSQIALFSNIRSSLYSLCGIGLLYIINRTSDNSLCGKIYNNIFFFNMILLINLIVLYIQSKGTGFLIRSSWLVQNPYYEDHCAGLFGANSTNVLGLYSIFVMVLNLSYAKMFLYKKTRRYVYIYTLCTQVVMAFLSQYNDNMGFYVLLLYLFALYTYTNMEAIGNIGKKLSIVISFSVIIVLVFIVVWNMPFLGDFIRNFLFDRIQRLFFYDNFGGASGSSERLAILRYAFLMKSTFDVGAGVGCTKWMGEPAFGFWHFGINSMGSYLILGGIWFCTAYTLLYSEIYYAFWLFSRKNKAMMRFVFITMVIVFSIYTTLFNDARTALLIGMISILYSRPRQLCNYK